MPACIRVQPVVIICRPKVPDSITYYDRETESDPRDPCVWMLEGNLNDTPPRYIRFFADDVVRVLAHLADINLAEDETKKLIGPITHTSARVHSVKVYGESRDIRVQDRKHDFNISLGSWVDEPHRKIADLVHRLRKEMPAECMQVWPETRALKTEFAQFIQRCLEGKQPGILHLNPISIIDKEVP